MKSFIIGALMLILALPAAVFGERCGLSFVAARILWLCLAMLGSGLQVYAFWRSWKELHDMQWQFEHNHGYTLEVFLQGGKHARKG